MGSKEIKYSFRKKKKKQKKSNKNKSFSYKILKCLDLVGVVMLVFAHKDIIKKCNNVDYLIQKTGMMGTMGNKGSCLLRFEIEDTSLAISSGHFAAGQSHNSSRISELNDIMSKNFTIFKSKKFIEHDIFFIFGDLNFRLDLDNNSVRSLIANKSLDSLIIYDQFLKTRSVNYSMNILDEGPLKFNPTYKYNLDSNDYDTKAKRIPSWCDRILFKKTPMIRQLCYDRKEYTYSDHKPIYSIFEVSICEEKFEEKLRFLKYLKRCLTFGLKIYEKIDYSDCIKKDNDDDDNCENDIKYNNEIKKEVMFEENSNKNRTVNFNCNDNNNNNGSNSYRKKELKHGIIFFIFFIVFIFFIFF